MKYVAKVNIVCEYMTRNYDIPKFYNTKLVEHFAHISVQVSQMYNMAE